jgi:hypothetical protein
MSRVMMLIVLILILNLLGVSRHTMAFTVRFGAVPATEDNVSIHGTADADLPTPRMFNVTVGADGATFETIATPSEAIITVREISARSGVEPRVANTPSTLSTRLITSSRQLSGAEIRLLRHAKQVTSSRGISDTSALHTKVR